MKIIFCTSEATPYAKTGGLADVCGSLPFVLKNEGLDVSVVMPFYASIDEKAYKIKKLTQDVFFTRSDGVDVYFIKNDNYFNRTELYGDAQGDYPDNLERFSFFNKRTLKFLKENQLRPDILHCHDWQTALIPAYLKTVYREDPFFAGTKTVFSIHNLAYQGIFPRQHFQKLGLPPELNEPNGLEFYEKLNFLKAGIILSDEVSTVSPTYAKEIAQKETGCGLEGVIRQRSRPVIGILNGIDTETWDPKTDALIEAPYWPGKIQGKALNKETLQAQTGLSPEAEIPVFGFVGRLSYQKGIDLIAQAIDQIATLDAQLIFLGVGEDKYHKQLKELQKKYPSKIGLRLDFDEKMAHQIYAGSDFFLMPSIYEPCGLSQMISFRYGTIPLVYKTGGLADTVLPFDLVTQQGDGFVFSTYEPQAFIRAFKKAIKTFKQKDIFEKLRKHVMHYDFSWQTSAKEYKKLYQQCVL